MKGQIVRVFTAIFFYVKFLSFVFWYRCCSKGNILEKTAYVFWTRFLLDIFLIFCVAYAIWLEIELDTDNLDANKVVVF